MVYSNIPYMHISYIVLGLSTCSTNAILIWIVLRKRIYRSIANIVIVSLATCDFLLGALIAPVEVIHTLRPEIPVVGYACLAHQVVMIYLPLVSVCHLLLVTLDRFIKIVFPLRYFDIATTRRVVIVIIAAWAVPLCISMFPFAGWKSNNSGNKNDTRCASLDLLPCSYIGFVFSIIILICLLMIILYSIILKIAFRHAKQIRCASLEISMTKIGKGGRELKAISVLVVTLGYFIISWTPFTVAVIEQCVTLNYPVYWVASVFLAYFNSTINAVIYGMGNRDLRTSLREACCRHSRRTRMEVPDTRITAISYDKTIVIETNF